MPDSSGMATGVAGGSSHRAARLASFSSRSLSCGNESSFYSLSTIMALYAVATINDGGLGWSTVEADKLTGDYALLACSGLPDPSWHCGRSAHWALPRCCSWRRGDCGGTRDVVYGTQSEAWFWVRAHSCCMRYRLIKASHAVFGEFVLSRTAVATRPSL